MKKPTSCDSEIWLIPHSRQCLEWGMSHMSLSHLVGFFILHSHYRWVFTNTLWGYILKFWSLLPSCRSLWGSDEWSISGVGDCLPSGLCSCSPSGTGTASLCVVSVTTAKISALMFPNCSWIFICSFLRPFSSSLLSLNLYSAAWDTH